MKTLNLGCRGCCDGRSYAVTMLRLGQTSARGPFPLAIRTSSAIFRYGSPPLPSNHDMHRKNGRDLELFLNGTVIHSRNENHTSSSNRNNNITWIPGKLDATMPNYHRITTAFSAACFKRNMSTSAAASGAGGASGSAASTAVQDAASSAASASAPDPTALADAATAAAGAADQAQAVAEAAPAAFKFALSSPPELAMMAVDGVHAATGMPYWMTIVAITLSLRTAILPIGALAARNAARTAKMQPEMERLQAAIQADQQSSQMRRAERYRQETRALYEKYDCSLLMNAALPLVQLPIFLSFFLGLRRMPEIFPDFATGGTLWFENLGAPDPYMIFPLTAGVTTLLLTELGGDGLSMATSSTYMRAGMRAMSLAIVPLTMNISVSIFIYWTTSNFYSVFQTLLLKAPIIRRRLNFPDSTKKHPKVSVDKELGWLDVLGGEYPLKVYRQMREQEDAQAWFGEGAPVMRKGAPLPPPHPTAMGGEARPVVKVAARAEAPQKPQVVTYAMRPKPAVETAGAENVAKGGGDRGKKKLKRRVS